MPYHEQDDELQDSPLLRGLRERGYPKAEPPGDYFARMQGELQNRLDDEAVLQAAPRLRQAGRGFPFSVPSDYFAQLPLRVEQRIGGSSPRVVPLWERISYGAVAAAAALALVWLLRSTVPSPTTASNPALAWDDISTEQLMALALENDLDPSLIVEVMGSEALISPQSHALQETEAWNEETWDEVLEEVELEDLEAAWLEGEALDG